MKLADAAVRSVDELRSGLEDQLFIDHRPDATSGTTVYFGGGGSVPS